MTMREILFRGYAEDYEKWFYGGAVQEDDRYYISGQYYLGECSLNEVIPETVGQFTGSLDRNGKKIFEGDIIKVKRTQYEIVYSSGCLFAKIKKGNTTYHKIIPGLGLNDTVVIGNIHYNPELLEVLSNA
jgi:uncharacterized phage protein (TIGR01671 family)